MRLLKDEGNSKHVYLKGKWLSLLIYFFTHSLIHQIFHTGPAVWLKGHGCAMFTPHASSRMDGTDDGGWKGPGVAESCRIQKQDCNLGEETP